MRREWASLVMGTALAVGAWTDATACGDKFLVVGRGRRMQMAAHPASILLYMNPKTPFPGAVKELQLQSTLKQAGHRTHAVETKEELDKALGTGKYDLVLADLSDMTALEPKVAGAPSKPSLLPVIYNPTGEELAAAEKEYSCVMRSPSKFQSYLAVIDDAMDLRVSRAKARASK